MRISYHHISKGRGTSVELEKGSIVTFGEGRNIIDISIDNDGAVRVSTHQRLAIVPSAANSILLESIE